MKVKDTLTTGQVAKICNVAPRTVSKWFDSGRLKGWRIPGSQDRRVTLASLVEFMKEGGFDAAMIPHHGDPRVLTVGRADGLLPGECGFIVRHASNAFEAGVAFAEFRPDAVVVELALGRIDAGIVAQGARASAICVAVAEPPAVGFHACILPSLSPAEKAFHVRLLLDGSTALDRRAS